VKLDKRHMGVSAAMLVGSIIYNVWVFTGGTKPKPTAQPSAPLQELPTGGRSATATGPIDPAQVKPLLDVAIDRLPEWPRNPFQDVRAPGEVIATTDDAPPAPVAEADPVVATILYSTDRKAAVVNGRIVRIGDMIGTSKVVDILPKAVIIESPATGRRTLDMKPGSGTGSVGGTAPSAAAPAEKLAPGPPGGHK
jgi:hypothetical protein